MNRGFISIILVLIIFLFAIVALNSTTINTNRENYKEIFAEVSLNISNYQILLNQISQNCDWSNDIALLTCVDSNSTNILSKINTNPQNLNCTARNFAKKDTDVNGELNCSLSISDREGELFNIDLNREIIVSKP